MFGRFFIAVLLLVPATSWAARGASQTTQDSFGVSQLIDALSDPDWTVRKQASERLAILGPAARPEIVRAARSDDPEQRARAAEILRKLPWYVSDDPESVRAILRRYGPASDAGRIDLIVQLLRTNAPPDVMLRLLNEEPSDVVRWTLVVALFQPTDPPTLQKLRELAKPDCSDPAELMLAGRAWLRRDRNKALALFRRAVDADRVHPSNDQGRLAYAYEELTKDALWRGDFDEAADLMRRQVPRDAMPSFDEEDEPKGRHLATLAALHRYFGPLRGIEDDRRTWGRDAAARGAGSQHVGDRVVALLSELGAAPPLPRNWKLNLSGIDRFAAGEFLLRYKFATAAELELREALPAAKREGRYVEFDVMHLLGQALGEAGRDAEAAEWLDKAMRLQQDRRLRLNDNVPDDDMRAEIAFRRARAAQNRGDDAAADKQVQVLLQCSPTNNDNTIAIVRWLKETKRDAAAHTLFEHIYAVAKERAPVPDPGRQNDLAWLCARCGEHVDEAVEQAKAALDADPDNAAFMDTLAEAQFVKGNRDEAVKLETRALELTPESDFMREQLERFKGGKP